MAFTRGRDVTIWVGTSSPGAGGTPTARVRYMKEPDDDPQLIKGDSTTNETAGRDAHEIIGDNRSISWKFLADRADPGQEILRTAQANKTKIYLAYREQGDGSTLPQELMYGSVMIKRTGPLRANTEYTATFERDGSVAPDATAQT